MKSWQINPVNKTLLADIEHKINQKTKPPGSLGKLETLAGQLALIFGSENIEITRPAILVFAADHGIAQHGISIAGSEVTALMVQNFIAGGAAINCFCRSNGLEFKVIDAGIITPVSSSSSILLNCRVGQGTADFSQQAAMTKAQLEQCFHHGSELVLNQIAQGSNIIGFGEMGIGNSSAAAAILSAMSGLNTDFSVGRGTGINDQQLALKKKLIQQGLKRIKSTDPMHVLTEVGGFEIAQICAGMLTAASASIAIVVDGFIVTAAAMLAQAINPAVTDYMIFAHSSLEPGHELMLAHLGATPLLDLSLRLGEGTGAALAMPLIKCAASFYNDMASFEQTQIEVH